MFQQNGYKNKEHLHWLKKKFRLQWILYFGLALGIVTCVFPYLALEIFEYLVLFVIIVVYRAMKRMNTKKLSATLSTWTFRPHRNASSM